MPAIKMTSRGAYGRKEGYKGDHMKTIAFVGVLYVCSANEANAIKGNDAEFVDFGVCII